MFGAMGELEAPGRGRELGSPTDRPLFSKVRFGALNVIEVKEYGRRRAGKRSGE
jgi:hypothetical protein